MQGEQNGHQTTKKRTKWRLRIMSTSKKLKSEQLFVRVETVMHDLQISRPFAYRMIAGWNEELKEQGYTKRRN